jgi:transcriptional regulator with XRE-family HTH domain
MPKSLHSESQQIIAKALADQRRSKGLSQAQVARALGRHQPFIANIESGERRVDLVELLELADVIGLDLGLLISALIKRRRMKRRPGG